jgi:hypothetical protein
LLPADGSSLQHLDKYLFGICTECSAIGTAFNLLCLVLSSFSSMFTGSKKVIIQIKVKNAELFLLAQGKLDKRNIK